jgi:hypothetical protein
MYQGHVLRSLLATGQSDAPFALTHYPVPYFASQALLAGLGALFGPIHAGRVLIAGYLVLGAWLSVRFVRSHRLRPLLGLLLLDTSIVVSSSFWNGYINYQLGMLVLLGYLALPGRKALHPLLVALFSLLAFACHAMALVALCAIVGSRALAHEPRRTLPRVGMALVPVLGLTLWYALARTGLESLGGAEPNTPFLSLRFLAYKVYTLAKAGPYHNFWVDGVADLQRTPALYVTGVLANLAYAGLLLLLLVRFIRRRNTPIARDLRYAAAALFVMYAFAPAFALGVVNPGERLLYPLLLCAFAVTLDRHGVSSPRLRWATGAATLAVMLMSLASLLALGSPLATAGAATASVAQPGFEKLLFWHRPFQFQERCAVLSQTGHSEPQPTLPLAFPSSIVINKGR